MKRDIQSYILKANHQQTQPSYIIYLDVESNRNVHPTHEVHTFKLGWTCYVNKHQDSKGFEGTWCFWETSFDLCQYIQSKTQDKSALWVFGHNVYYDIQVSEVFHYFRLWGWKYQFYYDKGLTYILVIRKGTRTIKFVSSTNYFSCSLAKLGELVGMEKKTIDFDTVDYDTLSRYCRHDVEILKKGMEYYTDFVTEHDLGKFSLTKSSQAMSAYRHRFMTHKLCRHEEKDIVDFERKAYHGGRVECFRVGECSPGPFLLLDINSMYPYVMKNYPLPIRCAHYVENPLPGSVRALLNKYSAVAEVVVETDEPAYAVHNREKLIFPVGRFTAYLCTGGLKYGFSKGHIKEVKRIAVYDQGFIFGHYIDYFYSLRERYKKDKNLIMDTLAKYFMNTLYGKFGEKHTIEIKSDISNDVPFHSEEIWNLVTGEHWVETSMFGVKVKKYGETEGPKSIVSIPAHITEYARFLIWQIIQEVGYESVYYCDTDSVIIRFDRIGKLHYPVHPTSLGALKVEKEIKNLILYGPKHYRVDDVHKIKGVPRTAQQIKPFVYVYPEFLRQASHMREGIERYYKVNYVEKDVTPFYDKGTVSDDGRVYPFQLEFPG